MLLAGLPWALGTAGQVINCDVDTSPELITFLKPSYPVGRVACTPDEICDYAITL